MRYQWVTGAVGSTTIAQTTSSTYSATNEGTYRVSLTDANPNGDGVNDTWELLNAADVPNITVTVFNRLGNVVFYSPGYPIPFTGAGLDNGVYSYVIQYGALPVRLAGSLTPIR